MNMPFRNCIGMESFSRAFKGCKYEFQTMLFTLDLQNNINKKKRSFWEIFRKNVVDRIV